MPVSPEEFRAALSRFASGITVVTSVDASGFPHGITVSAFCSVSLDPPLILVCIDRTTGSHHAVIETGVFVVNFLAAGQDEISERFSLTDIDKFELGGFRNGIGGVPVLDESLVSLECTLRSTFDGGDHSIFVGQVESVRVRDVAPLVYFHGSYRDLLDI